MADWYFVKDGQRCGPVSAEFIAGELRRGRLDRNDMAWCEAQTGWLPISELPELIDYAAKTPPPLPEAVASPLPSVPPVSAPPADLSTILPKFEIFGLRGTAMLIDSGLLLVPASLLLFIIAATLQATNAAIDFKNEDDWVRLQLMFQLCALPGVWLYYAFFESSVKQATPGKLLMGLKVTREDGGPLTFWHASGRFLLKYLTLVPFGLVFALLSPSHQVLHDLATSTTVIKR